MRKLTLPVAVASALAMTPVLADENPYLQQDDTWISLNGKVVNVGSRGFTLDYGFNTVEVEMDDWSQFGSSMEAVKNSRVTVYGEVDDDTFEKTSIEAGSVYVESLGTYFYASTDDKSGLEGIDFMPQTPIIVGNTSVTGTVTSVDGRQFTIDSGEQKVTIDTRKMATNPLDDQGFQQIDKGQQVTVTGKMEEDLFETRELMATSIVTLTDESA